MSISINQRNCLVSRKNLGFSDCVVEAGRPVGFILVPEGWSLELETDTFNLTYVNSQIQAGNFVPVLGAVDFTNNTPDPTTEEYQSGIKSVVRQGLPEFTFKFIKGGWKYASALYTYNSQQAFDILIVHENGVVSGSSNGTVLRGFDLGMLNTGTYMFTDGNASGYVNVMMQLINADQYNREVAMLTPDVLDFNPTSDLFPITDIVMDGTADASDGKVYFSAKFAMNEASVLGGISTTNLRVTINGVEDVVTSCTYNSTTSKYEIEITSAIVVGNKVVVQLYDAVNSVATAKIGSKYFKGATSEITVTA